MSAGKAIGGIAGAIVLFGVWCGYSTNKYIQPWNNVKASVGDVQNVEDIGWRQITTMASAVGSYAQHEKDTFVGTAQGRGGINPTTANAVPALPPRPAALKASPEELMKNPALNAGLEQANTTMSNYVNAAVEAYPNLKADKLYKDLMVTISSTNNRIGQERRRQIQYTKEYNIQIQQFPAWLTAKLMGYSELPYYTAPEGHTEAPKIFGDK